MSTVYNKLINNQCSTTPLYYAFSYANDNPDNMVASHHVQNIAQELEQSNKIFVGQTETETKENAEYNENFWKDQVGGS